MDLVRILKGLGRAKGRYALLFSNLYRCALATLSITRRYIYCYFGSSPKGATQSSPQASGSQSAQNYLDCTVITDVMEITKKYDLKPFVMGV